MNGGEHVPPGHQVTETIVGAVPQAYFNDLYTAVYTLIDDAKTAYRLLKLYKGSHGSPNPHESVTEFGAWFFQQRRGLLGYACDTVAPSFGRPTVDDLAEYDFTHRPRVSTAEVFRLLAKSQRKAGETAEQYLNHVTTRVHELGAYRGGSSGYDDEARAFACAHFRQLGIPSVLDDVMVFSGGAKGVLLACCAALMCSRTFEKLHQHGGVILAPAGYYQSLRLIPPIFGGTIHVEPELTGGTVANWLIDTARLRGRAIYLPLVNNMDGRVLTREQACGIAAAVVDHNLANPRNSVYVLGDDVYVGAYLDADITPCPIGAAPGIAQWCVSIVTPSKTFTLPTARVAFVTTMNAPLRQALAHYRAVFSHGRVPQVCELSSAAALCLTPPKWIDRWNRWHREKLRYVIREITALNTELGEETFRAEEPQGGWYVSLRINRALLGERARTNVDALAVLLYYGQGDEQSGLAMLPGELFGRGCEDGWYTLRANMATDTGTIDQTVQRLRDVAMAMRGDRRTQILDHALDRARQVVPELDQIVAHRRY